MSALEPLDLASLERLTVWGQLARWRKGGRA